MEQNWEQIKLKEKDGNRSILAGVPRALPALIKAYRIQEKAANAGFDWEQPHQVWDKVREEIAEFEAAAKSGDAKDMEAEMGDVFFSLINAARLYHIIPPACSFLIPQVDGKWPTASYAASERYHTRTSPIQTTNTKF